ncbi:Uncharacterised protein [uncultured Clostridium sp.]|uniref:hypothetical protein n=1 Tax=uncultured Clostridium sp. TaxID=59620 RepID=UPI000820F158|nr:hypothetical protein [uncultured Clostridium sp.]SCK04353.1 Uncharacterised protein [uncultured Clostridium sp.]
MKKIAILIVLMLSMSLVACGESKKKEAQDSSESAVFQEIQEISKEEKENIKAQAEKLLDDKNITYIDVLTDSETGEAMLSIQLQGNILKEESNIEELEELTKEIDSRVSEISTKNTIELIDKNYQMILMYSNGEFQYF